MFNNENVCSIPSHSAIYHFSCRNMVDPSMYTHNGGAPTTNSNSEYEMMVQGEEGGGGGVGQGSHVYELVGVSPGTSPPIAKAAGKKYGMPSPPSHLALPIPYHCL